MANNSLSNTKINITYSSLLHAGGVPIPSVGQAQLYDGNGTTTALKLGANCNGATICGTLSATSLAGVSLNLSTKLTPDQLNILELVKILYPLNAIVYTADSTNPGTRSGWIGTTWEQISQGRFIVGVGTGTDNNTITQPFSAGNNFGEYNHSLVITEIPSHTHSLNVDGEQFYITNDANTAQPTTFGRFRGDGPSGDNDGRYCPTLPSTGGGLSHNNIPPGFGLWVWKRIA